MPPQAPPKWRLCEYILPALGLKYCCSMGKFRWCKIVWNCLGTLFCGFNFRTFPHAACMILLSQLPCPVKSSQLYSVVSNQSANFCTMGKVPVIHVIWYLTLNTTVKIRVRGWLFRRIVYHSVPGKRSWALKHNLQFWPAWVLTRDQNFIRLYRSCYSGPLKCSTWALTRE